MNDNIIVEKIGERKICIRGIGKMFFQDGFPISISISEMKKRGIEVSIFHVADECLKNGWSSKTTYNKLKSDIQDDIDGNNIDLEQLKTFCFAEYEEQREMIFNYLFGSSSNDAMIGKNNLPMSFIKSKILV